LSYSVIYLENHKCRICSLFNRNIIEPVAVFVPMGKEYQNLKQKFEELNPKQLEEELKKYYQKIKGKIKTQVPDENSFTYKTCILHCEKENEIWIENFNDGYEEYAKRRDKAIQEEKPFNEKFEIKWNENLVNEFWKRIRAYRFAVDYKEKWDSFEGIEEEKWEQLKQLLPEETQNEIEKNINLILFYLRNLNKEKVFYDFRKFIFPIFQYYSPLNPQTKDKFLLIPKNSNFFYSFEKLKFEYEVNFRESKFYDKCIFLEVKFSKNTYFREVSFYNIVDFSVSQFYNDVDFTLVQFFDIVDFSISKYYKEVYFFQTKFYSDTIFSIAQFHNRSYFFEIQFYGEANFRETQFYGNVDFFENQFYRKADFREAKFHKKANFKNVYFFNKVVFWIVKIIDKAIFDIFGNNLIFDLSYIQLSENSEIEVKNLKTYRLILNDINNKSKNFFFYDTEIITLEEYKDYAQKENIKIDEKTLKEVENSPNLEIVNSHLNQMKFINCDFSKAKHIKIESSDLTEVKFLATDWGDISEKRICPEMFKNQTKKARDVYRQLKLTLDNHRDYFSANGFYSLEMKTQEKILEETLRLKKEKDNIFQDLKILGKLIWKFRKLPKEKYELLVLKIHKLSSDFGQSWTKPLMWLFTISFITSFIFQFGEYKNLLKSTIDTAQKTYWSYEKGFLIAMWEAVKLYFKILELILSPFLLSVKNIAEITKTIKGEFNEGNLWIIFILFLYTIISAFLIYQFAGAVRRKVKR